MIFGQEKKNTIAIYASPSLTKTNLNRLDLGFTGWFKTLASLEQKTGPIYAFNYGINYQRYLSAKVRVGIGFGYETKGEKSKRISVNNPNNPNSQNVWVKYKYKLESFHVPLSLSLELSSFSFLKRKATSVLGFGFIGDVYYRYTGEDYLIFKDTGSQRKGGQTEVALYGAKPVASFFRNLKKGYVRMGFVCNYGFQWKIISNVYMEPLLELAYYTNTFEKSPLLISGDALRLSAKINLGYKF